MCSSKIPFYNADLSPIKTRLVSLANSCTATLYAILAVSATHLASDSDSKSQIRALSYRQKAISFLNQELETMVSTPVQNDHRQWAMDRAIFTSFLIGCSYVRFLSALYVHESTTPFYVSFVLTSVSSILIVGPRIGTCAWQASHTWYLHPADQLCLGSTGF